MDEKYNVISNIWYALKNIWKWHRNFFIWFLPAIPLEVIVPLLVIYFPKVLISAIEKQVSVEKIIVIIGGYFIIIFLADTWKRFCKAKRSSRRYLIGNRYELETHKKFMSTDYANIENPKIVDKYFGVMGDIWNNNSAEDIWESVLNFFVNLLGVVTYGGIILTVSPIILLFLFLSAVIIWGIGRYHIKWLKKNQDQWLFLDRKKNYISSFSKDFEFAKDIRIHNMSEWLDKKYCNLICSRLFWTKKLNHMDMVENVISSSMLLIQNALAYWVLCSMIFEQSITLSEFTFYFSTITGFSAWLNSIIYGLNGLIRQGTAIGYYRDFFEIKDYYRHDKGCDLPKGKELPPVIEFEDVSFRYEGAENWLFQNLSFRIESGEKLAIVGENGAGKTTLVKLICGLYFPEKGNIKVNGISTTDFCIEDYYSLFAIVFQDIHLLPISIGEFVSCKQEKMIDMEKVEKSIELAGLNRKISSLKRGISTKLVRGVYADAVELSGGEQQKLMLARALYKEASIIILDEPSSALDSIAESELYEQYTQLTKKKTGIYISHRLASTAFCDRILFLENGKIIEEGTHIELMKQNGKYAYMYDVQSQYYREK